MAVHHESCPLLAITRVAVAAMTLSMTPATASSLWGQAPDETKEMKLWKEVDTRQYAGCFVCPGDLDNDGSVDFLLYRQGPMTTPGYLAALNSQGSLLWSLGDATIVRHTADGAYHEPALRGIALVFDIDRDGRSEVVTEYWKSNRPMLYILDGATGAIEHERESPLDLKVRSGRRSRCHPVGLVAFLQGQHAAPAIVLKYEASGRVPTHAFALNAELETLWHLQADPTAMGHLPTVGDIDADGKDEIALGTTLVDDDGHVMWRKSAGQHADCTDIFCPTPAASQAVLVSICNTGPAYCLSSSGKTIWEKSRTEVCHGQGIWAGDFLPESDGLEVIVLKSGHCGDFATYRGSDGGELATFQQRRAFDGYPDFPCVVQWREHGEALWIPIDRCLVDGRGEVVADLGRHETYVQKRLRWGTTKAHVATQAIPLDICGDQRHELVLYQPYNGEAILIFTQSDSSGRVKPYVQQPAAYNIKSYF
jgi:hypothetical protein